VEFFNGPHAQGNNIKLVNFDASNWALYNSASEEITQEAFACKDNHTMNDVQYSCRTKLLDLV